MEKVYNNKINNMERQEAILKAFYESLMLTITHFSFREDGLHYLERIKKKLEVVDINKSTDNFNFYHRYTLQCIDDAIENTLNYYKNKPQ